MLDFSCACLKLPRAEDIRPTYSTILYCITRSLNQSFKARPATSPPVNSIITIPALLNDATYQRGI